MAEGRKWLIEVSDVITGALIIRDQRFTAGRYVTSDPYIVERIAQEDGRYFSVRELKEDEEVEEGPSDPVGQDDTGTLTRDDVRNPAGRTPGKVPCSECGVEYKNLNQHGRLSGHDVHGAEASKEAGEAADAAEGKDASEGEANEEE